MIHGLLIGALTVMFAYALFSDEIEEEIPETPKRKKLQVKRNGEWENIER